MEVPDDQLVERVTAFNVGIEVGQLCALAAFLTCVCFIRSRGKLKRMRHSVGAVLVYAGAGLALYFTALLV